MVLELEKEEVLFVIQTLDQMFLSNAEVTNFSVVPRLDAQLVEEVVQTPMERSCSKEGMTNRMLMAGELRWFENDDERIQMEMVDIARAMEELYFRSRRERQMEEADRMMPEKEDNGPHHAMRGLEGNVLERDLAPSTGGKGLEVGPGGPGKANCHQGGRGPT